jgi:site-specific DNA-methyltransferase (adenine-specific)
MQKDHSTNGNLDHFVLGYPHTPIGRSQIILADCLEWLAKVPHNSFHAIVTDPPYGLTEYDADQLLKRENGRGGIWRLPPAFDGAKRAPLPRFTALNERERKRLSDFFANWSRLVVRGIRPGGHVFIATNSFMSQILYGALVSGGLEYRGEIIRLVKTLRGGDRPKNAEEEFPNVSSLPRGCFEPWGIFRKPLPSKMTVAECLREFETGGIRRTVTNAPLDDIIPSERTPRAERKIANHPSLKPQSFLRKIVHCALPLGKGILVDPFMGSGSTIAAAESVGVAAIGLEVHAPFYDMARVAVSRLKSVQLNSGVFTHLGKSNSVPSSQIHSELHLPL